MGEYIPSLILACGFLALIITFWFFNKSRFTFSISSLVVSGLFFRIYSALDPFLHAWDERYHALVAKNLLKHPLVPTLYDIPLLDQDLLWVGSHIWLHKQPLALWLISGSISIFGNTDFAIRIPSILLSTAMIWLTYLIGRFLFTKRIGVLAAFFIAVNGLIIELTAGRVATDHVDICFTFFIELGFYFAIKHWQNKKLIWAFLMSVSVGLAILSKSLPALIVIPFWLTLIYSKERWKQAILPLSMSLLVIGLVFIPWQVYIHLTFPLEAFNEQSLNWRHLTEVIENQSGPFYYFINKIRINYGELIYLPLIWFLISGRKFLEKNIFISLSLWIIIPLVFFSIPLTKMQGYILFIAPALFLVTAYFLENLNSISLLKSKKWLPKLILFAFCFFAIRYSLERMKIGSERQEPEWKREILDIAKNNEGKKLVLFNCQHYVEAMYYTELIAYDKTPNEADLKKIKEAGYYYLILSTKNRE